MAFARDDIETIRRLIREELDARSDRGQAFVRYDLELRERTIRVEEELKHQRELMERVFRLTEQRIEQADKPIEQIDKRFEETYTAHGPFRWCGPSAPP